MYSSLSLSFFQKGRILRRRCAQLKATENYVDSSSIVLNGRTLVELPTGNNLIVPSIQCLTTANEILDQLTDISFADQQDIVVAFLYLQTVVASTLEGASSKLQRACKKLLLEVTSSHNLIFLNESNKAINNGVFQNYSEGESLLLFKARQIIAACKYLQEQENQVTVLCFNEFDPLYCICQSQNIPVTTLSRFIGDPKLILPPTINRISLTESLLSLCTTVLTNNESDEGSNAVYPPHLIPAVLCAGIREGRFISGVLSIYDHTPNEGEVIITNQTTNGLSSKGVVLIHGKINLNRGLDGDLVAVELLPESQWGCSSAQHLLVTEADADDPSCDTDFGNSIGVIGMKMKTGRVVGIIRRDVKEVVVTVPMGFDSKSDRSVSVDQEKAIDIVTGTNSREEFVLVVPLARKIPKLRLKTRQLASIKGHRAVVQVDNWPRDSTFPNCHFIRILGDPLDWRTDVDALLFQHSIVPRPFTKQALDCLPIVPNVQATLSEYNNLTIDWRSTFRRRDQWIDSQWEVPANEIKNRLDMRASRRVFSVDPPGCQDIDDTMSVHWLQDDLGRDGFGQVEIGVMIADVCAFLDLGSPLDLEAQARGTTVYLPHVRFDMLPGLLSSDIASLHGGKDRYAVATTWLVRATHSDGSPVLKQENPIDLDDNNDIQFALPDGAASWMGRVVIKSIAAMTYGQAHNLIRELPPDSEGNQVPLGQAGRPVAPNLWPALTQDLRLLTAFARFLKRQRMQGNALELHQSSGSELRFDVTATGVVAGMHGHEELEIHNTIAEFMILANSAVAKTILFCCPNEALMRIHPPAASTNLGDVSDLLILAGVNPATATTTDTNEFNQDFAMALRDVRSLLARSTFSKKRFTSEQEIQAIVELVTSVLIRAMSEAKYVCSGSLSGKLHGVAAISASDSGTSEGKFLGHSGLGLEYYTHFTSPIRRYSDIVVHRQLIGILASPDWKDPFLLREVLPVVSLSNNSKPQHASVVIPESILPTLLPSTCTDRQLAHPQQEAEDEAMSFPSYAGGEADLDGLLDDLLGYAAPVQQAGTSSSNDMDSLLDNLLDDVASSAATGPHSSQIQTNDIDSDLDKLLLDVENTNSAPLNVPSVRPTHSQEGVKVVSDSDIISQPVGITAHPYSPQEVAAIADHLNVMNRRSKRVQSDCQDLFLCLYLTNRVETHSAVVYSLRENGILVYIPALDFKGPLYLQDRSGLVCIDPQLLSHPPNGMIPSPAEFQGNSLSRPGSVMGCPGLVCKLRSQPVAFSSQETPLGRVNAKQQEELVVIKAEDVAADYPNAMLTLSPMNNIIVEVTCSASQDICRKRTLQICLVGIPSRRIAELKERLTPVTQQPVNHLSEKLEPPKTETISKPCRQPETLQNRMRFESGGMLLTRRNVDEVKVLRSLPVSIAMTSAKSRVKRMKLSHAVNISSGRDEDMDSVLATGENSERANTTASKSMLGKDKTRGFREKLSSEIHGHRFMIANSGRISYGSEEDIRPLFKLKGGASSSQSTTNRHAAAQRNPINSNVAVDHATASLSAGRALAMANMAAWGEAWAEEEDLPEYDTSTAGPSSAAGTEARGGGGVAAANAELANLYRKETALASARLQKLKVAKRRSKYD